jgi:hypothetical protein
VQLTHFSFAATRYNSIGGQEEPKAGVFLKKLAKLA